MGRYGAGFGTDHGQVGHSSNSGCSHVGRVRISSDCGLSTRPPRRCKSARTKGPCRRPVVNRLLTPDRYAGTPVGTPEPGWRPDDNRGSEIVGTKKLPAPESVSRTIDLQERLRLFNITADDVAAARELWTVIEPEARTIAVAHFDQSQKVRGTDSLHRDFDRMVELGVNYLRNRFTNLTGSAWVEIVRAHRRHGVPGRGHADRHPVDGGCGRAHAARRAAPRDQRRAVVPLCRRTAVPAALAGMRSVRLALQRLCPVRPGGGARRAGA